MQLGDGGTAIIPDGGIFPGGSYQVYARVEIDDDGSVDGEVHFLSEPKYPRPISSGIEFDLLMPIPDDILSDNIYLRVRFIDEGGIVVGYRRGSLAQFKPKTNEIKTRIEEPKATPLDKRNVFVVHGRDERLRKGMFDFLRSIDLNPMEWAPTVTFTGKGAPYVGEILDAAFANAQAIIVLLTPDDLAQLRPELWGTNEPSYEVELTPQARPNVLFEAGMSMARNPDRTVLVEIGVLRPFSDIGGRHAVRMDNSSQKRNDLALRLRKAGCPVNLNGSDWHTAGDLSPPIVHPPKKSEAIETRTDVQIEPPSHLMADLISELEDNLSSARAPRVGDVYKRPSSRVWKDCRNKLDIPPDVRHRTANAYKQIDEWLDIVVSGLSPNLGSMTLELKVNDLRHDLPNLIGELKKLEGLSQLPKLSNDAQELLLKASDEDGGSITVLEMNEGFVVQVNHQQFTETGNRRSEAKWRAAVDELLRLGLIKRPSRDADVIDVTHAGYQCADKLRST
jgi:predicted nucleotide-binding protein